MRTNQFPTDNWLRDDIGLPLLAQPRAPLMLTPRISRHFPADDRLRDDVGLPPIGDGFPVESVMASRFVSTMQRLALACAAVVRIVGGSLSPHRWTTAVAAMLRPRHHGRIVP